MCVWIPALKILEIEMALLRRTAAKHRSGQRRCLAFKTSIREALLYAQDADKQTTSTPQLLENLHSITALH